MSDEEDFEEEPEVYNSPVSTWSVIIEKKLSKLNSKFETLPKSYKAPLIEILEIIADLISSLSYMEINTEKQLNKIAQEEFKISSLLDAKSDEEEVELPPRDSRELYV